jgi:N-acetyl-anhydromuramyl-L-alanine amidase AmpD
MVIDETTYTLPKKNFLVTKTPKTKIILANTFTKDMKHVKGWLHRYNGYYKNTAPFTISKDGKVYKHYEPMYSNKLLKNNELNLNSIIILLENEGWLLKNLDKNEFITWLGDIYDETDKIVEKRWRGHNYWVPYTDEQLNSAVKLSKMLCYEYNIPLFAIGHNTKIENIMNQKGVFYKSNIEKHYVDLNPSWDFYKFKEKLEENERTN